jgi:ABC-type dipeptide/oligopeptide/nickel transport system ATPase component
VTSGPATVPLMRVRDLTVAFPTLRGLIYPANGVNLLCHRGRTLGLVGESGCGKSITLRSLIRLIPEPGDVISGAVEWDSDDLLRWPVREVESLRGREIAMIFQDPTASLNPVHTVGHQIEEVLRVKLGLSQREAQPRAIDLLDRVGIPNPRARSRLCAPVQRRHAPTMHDRDRDRVRTTLAPCR